MLHIKKRTKWGGKRIRKYQFWRTFLQRCYSEILHNHRHENPWKKLGRSEKTKNEDGEMNWEENEFCSLEAVNGNKRTVQLSRLLHVSWGHRAATSVPGLKGVVSKPRYLLEPPKYLSSTHSRFTPRPHFLTVTPLLRASFHSRVSEQPDPFPTLFTC